MAQFSSGQLEAHLLLFTLPTLNQPFLTTHTLSLSLSQSLCAKLDSADSTP